MKYQKAKSVVNQHAAAVVAHDEALVAVKHAEAVVQHHSDAKRMSDLEDLESELKFLDERRIRLTGLIDEMRESLRRPNPELAVARAKLTAARVAVGCLETRIKHFEKELAPAKARIAEIETLEAQRKKDRELIILEYKRLVASDKNLTEAQRANIDFEAMADKFLKSGGQVTAEQLGGRLIPNSGLK